MLTSFNIENTKDAHDIEDRMITISSFRNAGRFVITFNVAIGLIITENNHKTVEFHRDSEGNWYIEFDSEKGLPLRIKDSKQENKRSMIYYIMNKFIVLKIISDLGMDFEKKVNMKINRNYITLYGKNLYPIKYSESLTKKYLFK